MARNASRRLSNGLRRRVPKRRATPNERWLHLSAVDVSMQGTLQTMWYLAATFCNVTSLILAVVLAVESVANGDANMTVIDDAIETLIFILSTYLGMDNMLTTIDAMLYDISPEEEDMPKQFTAHKGVRIDDISDIECHKMTHFYHDQLRLLYDQFDLVGHLASIGETMVPLYTGHFVRNTPCRYLLHPEEVFLFMMTKVATGRTNQSLVDEYFGGDYAKWSRAYPWMLRYLDDRYEDIIGHQGLTRFLDDFPLFNQAIEEFVQRDRVRERVNGDWVTVEGIDFLPFDIFGFLDDSIDQCSVPFSGPRGDYEGAARREEYADAQRSVYSGYKHFHGIKVETVFLPNGISTLFGPVSARNGDAGVEHMSNLNAYLVWLQTNMFVLLNGAQVYFAVFGDGAFSLGLQCIQTYFRSFGVGGVLSDDESKCNNALKAARITIEKNYAMVSNIFRICKSVEGLKLAQNRPYALEQLRVCHLLTNCYICLNGDQAGSDNTFGVDPPSLEEYLQL